MVCKKVSPCPLKDSKKIHHLINCPSIIIIIINIVVVVIIIIIIFFSARERKTCRLKILI